MKIYILIETQDQSDYSEPECYAQANDAYNSVVAVSYDLKELEAKKAELEAQDAAVQGECDTDPVRYVIEEQEIPDIKVAIEVDGGLVQSVYANGPVKVDVFDLDVSDVPEGDEEIEEAAERGKQLKEIQSDPAYKEVF